MRFSARTWSLLSLLLFVAAAFFWLKGNEYEARKRLAPAAPAKTNAQAGSIELFSTRTATMQLAKLSTTSAENSDEVITEDSISNGKVDSEAVRKRYPHRLRNTQKPLRELVRDDNAVLLANALIDTTGADPEIPRHLRGEGDPGSYIVQWKGPADARFREELSAAGAEIISYVPNNAYFVKVNKAGADRLSATAGVQSVLPFQPYYKLDPALLALAVKQEPLPSGATLRLTFLPGSTHIAQQVIDLGVEVLTQENSPFGPQLIVNPRSDALVPLARLSSIQGIERSVPRVPASDLSRTILGITTNGEASTENYLGLKGQGVLVNINDVGIQPNHPTLVDTTILLPAPPVAGLMTAGDDPDGHGTFVASLIAGNGNQTPETFVTNTVVTTNGAATETNEVVVQVLPGSSTNASLRGIAPLADLLALPLDPVGPVDVHAKLQETWMIESAAATNYLTLGRTNTLISNNSWTYQNLPIYDTSAARYDQAVRDALPGVSNHQPLLFVFSAGNGGFGETDGFGGRFDSIESPGTAKNVITVGALEMPRFITNANYTNYTELTITNIDGSTTTTNVPETVYPFAGITDSEDELAEFSSRGNVGIGVEGDMGRFKPDVVAPGTMVIAARSAGWDFNGFDTNDTNFGQMYFNLHTNLQPYRFESGSTIAAANISGMMALIQEYFQAKAPAGTRSALSPALMKALLINSARSLNRNYDVAAQAAANYQGWGLPTLPNSLTSYSTNDHASLDEKKWRLRTVEQSAANALATGQSRTWNVTLNSNSVTFPMRVTLVWTDPPGNPGVAVKLVNDLDLVVTNLDTGLVYYGNNIPFGSEMTIASDPVGGDPVVNDVINNVEQVMVANPALLGNRFSITVKARRVNVNAVPDYRAVNGSRSPNDVVQDFALVVSSEIGSNPLMNDPDPTNPNGYLPNLDVFDEFVRVDSVGIEPRREWTKITNGLPLIDQRVGANPSILGGNGVVGQWNFYVFTNITESNSLVTAVAGSNVAFVTFNPPNLSRPRAIEADIDLYVSKDPQLTNLNSAAIAGAFKSLGQGGTESVVFTNAVIGDVYYVGVKAEDQEAAEFSLIGVSSDRPFEEERDGRIYLYGVPFQAAVLDGNPKRPTAGTMLAIGLSNRRVAHAQVTTSTFHENFPDLVGVLSKQRTRVILNNHNFSTNNFGTNTFVYEDNPSFEIPGVTQPTDGPGNLNELVGYKIVGPWFLEMIDNSPSHTGRVQRFEIAIDPLRDDLLLGQLITGSVEPGEFAFYPLDVPIGVTNLNFLFTVDGPLEFYWREEALPTTNEFDVFRNLTPPGAQFDIPVTGNRTYYMGLRNPGAVLVNFTLLITPSYADTNFNRFYDERTVPVVPDVATVNSVIDIGVDKLVSDVMVGVHMKHPRTADIALTLISPQGSRILLAENRGGGNSVGFGSTMVVTNTLTNGTVVITNEPTFLIFTDRTNLTRIPVKFANPGGTNALSGVAFGSTFEFDAAGNYFGGDILADDWRVSSTGQVSVINGPGYARSGNGMLSLGTGGISNIFNTTPGRPLLVRFSARRARVMDFFSTGVSDTGGPLFPSGGAMDPHYHIFNLQAPAFQLWGDEPPLQPPAIWTANGGLQSIPGSFSQWIAPYPRVPRTDFIGEFVFRTYVNLYEQNPATFARQFRWAADDIGTAVRINGNTFGAFVPGAPADFWNSPAHTLPPLNPGLNIIDFVINDTNDVEGLRVDVPVTGPQRLRKSPVAEMIMNIGPLSQTIRVTNNWTDHVFAFSPTSLNDILSFQTRTGEVWIDEITVEASGGTFLHPEEPFELLEGERAMGEWRLEVRDTRTGAVLPTSEVLDWSLEVAFAETRNPALQMEPGETAGPITLGSEEVLWVVLDPCQGATFARLELRAPGAVDELMVFADLNGFPTGLIETDDFVPIPNTGANGVATFEINTLLPPPARLNGKPIFIGIINQFIGVTNQFTLEFTSDGNCSAGGPPPILTPDNPQVGIVDPDPNGGSNTNSMDGIFQFDVPPNARAAIVTVDSSGDVVVYGKTNDIPTSGSFNYRVDDVPGAGTETMVIDMNSTPPLSPVRHYVRVVNKTQVPVNFTINVTFDFGNSAPITVEISKGISANPVLRFFPTVAGVTYRIEAAEALSLTPGATVWTLLETRVATGTVETYEITSFDFTRRHRFFRITRP